MPGISEYLVLPIMASPQQQCVVRLKAYSNKLKAEFILRYSQHSVINIKLMLYSYIYIAIKKQTESRNSHIRSTGNGCAPGYSYITNR